MNKSGIKLTLKVYFNLLIYILILAVLLWIDILGDFTLLLLTFLLILISPTIILYTVSKHFDAYPPRREEHGTNGVFRTAKNFIFDLALYPIIFLSLFETSWKYAFGKSNYMDLIYLIIALIASVLVAPTNLKIASRFIAYVISQKSS